MKTVGIIAEFNPFHRGHEYLIREARRLTAADYVIIVMSGDFVQRGSIALLSKYRRAEMALTEPLCADLVLELPVLYASGSAEYFAEGGVSLLNGLGCVDTLIFGTETDQIDSLQRAAAFYADPPESEPSLFRETLRSLSRQGVPFPKARMEAYLAVSGEGDAVREILQSPNNILSIEYMKAILRSQSRMQPLPIIRIGQGHLDSSPGADFSVLSASSIRRSVLEGTIPERAMPDSARAILLEEMKEGRITFDRDLDLLLHDRLLSLTAFGERPEALSRYLDVDPDLANRTARSLAALSSFQELFSSLKTRQIPEARLRRALLHILLDITKEKAEVWRKLGSPYAKILGFRREAAPLLTEIRRQGKIPLLSRLSQAESLLGDNAFHMLKADLHATALRDMILAEKTGKTQGSEYSRKILKI